MRKWDTYTSKCFAKCISCLRWHTTAVVYTIQLGRWLAICTASCRNLRWIVEAGCCGQMRCHRTRLVCQHVISLKPTLQAVQQCGEFISMCECCLNLSSPIPLRLYTLPYWYNPPVLIFDIRALWWSGLSARQSAQMSKIKNGRLDQYGAESFERQQFAVTAVYSQLTVSSTMLWGDFVNGHLPTVWFMVCYWSHSLIHRQTICTDMRDTGLGLRNSDLAETTYDEVGQKLPGCWIVWLVTIASVNELNGTLGHKRSFTAFKMLYKAEKLQRIHNYINNKKLSYRRRHRDSMRCGCRSPQPKSIM